MSTEPVRLEGPSGPSSTTGTGPVADTDGDSREGARARFRRVVTEPDAKDENAERPAPKRPRPKGSGLKGSGQKGSGTEARSDRRPNRRARKVRRVHRVVRHIEIWSVAKMTTLFVICGYVISMVSGYLLWRAADRVGTIDGVEGFMEDAGGYDRFEILGDVVFRSATLIGAVLGVLTIALVVLASVLFNLLSDLTGGIRMTVIDEDLIVAPARPRPPQTGPTPSSDA